MVKNAIGRRGEVWLLGLFIVNLGIVSGAGLYESRIIVPQWLITLPSGEHVWRADIAAKMNVGLRFWAFVSTGPLTALVLVNLWRAARSREPRLRLTWLTSAILVFIERGLTFSFFIPTMLELFDAKWPKPMRCPWPNSG